MFAQPCRQYEGVGGVSQYDWDNNLGRIIISPGQCPHALYSQQRLVEIFVIHYVFRFRQSTLVKFRKKLCEKWTSRGHKHETSNFFTMSWTAVILCCPRAPSVIM